jgi:neopullulanase
MNYQFVWPAVSFFAAQTFRQDYLHPDLPFKPFDAEMLAAQMAHMYDLYHWEINFAQLNMLDSHDMPRILWLVGEDKSALRLCVLFQLTMPGVPCVYYGDEIGLSGGTDPDCRAAFPWAAEAGWDKDLLSFYRQAIALRHSYPALRTGSFQLLYAKDDIYAFRRQSAENQVVVIFNAASEARSLTLPSSEMRHGQFVQVWPLNDEQTYRFEDEPVQLSLPARDALILVKP